MEEEGVSRVKEKFSILSPVNGVLQRRKNAGDVVKKGEVVAVIDWDYKRQVLSPIAGKILLVQRERDLLQWEMIMDIGDTSKQEIVAGSINSRGCKD